MTQNPARTTGYTPPSLEDLDLQDLGPRRDALDEVIVSWGRYPGPLSPLAGNVGQLPPVLQATPGSTGGYTPPSAA